MSNIEYISPDIPDGWPANGREEELQTVLDATKNFDKAPNYTTKEKLISLLNHYDVNQTSTIGKHRITQYEVALLNFLFCWGLNRQLASMSCYLYSIVGSTTRMQKIAAYILSEFTGNDETIYITEYEAGLIMPLKLYYCAYQDHTLNKKVSFADQIINTVKYEMEGVKHSNLSNEAKTQAIFEISKGLTIMLSDISYSHGNKNEGIWQFTRGEILKLFSFEAKLLKLSQQQLNERPLRSILINQVSNYILKSRYHYNQDYICKYIPETVSGESVSNHEIWMKRTDALNDEKEGKVVKEIFEDREWIKADWVGKLDFRPKRQYYVSSFSKSYENDDMIRDYGPVIYGYKSDTIAELISPLTPRKHIPGTLNLEDYKNKIKFSLVTFFDILYDTDELKDEFNYLFQIIDILYSDKADKNAFLNEILQYWILSAKEIKWKSERERRYVLFIYDTYYYPEITIEDVYLKEKSTIFLYPDFLLGPHQKKDMIISNINQRRNILSRKPYLFCNDCLNRDYDVIVLEKPTSCPICKRKNIEIVYPVEGNNK